jgi:hypothetical protein
MSGAAALSAARNRRTNPQPKNNASSNAVSCANVPNKKGGPAPQAKQPQAPQMTKAQQYAMQQQQQQQQQQRPASSSSSSSTALTMPPLPVLHPLQVLRLHDNRLTSLEQEISQLLLKPPAVATSATALQYGNPVNNILPQVSNVNNNIPEVWTLSEKTAVLDRLSSSERQVTKLENLVLKLQRDMMQQKMQSMTAAAAAAVVSPPPFMRSMSSMGQQMQMGQISMSPMQIQQMNNLMFSIDGDDDDEEEETMEETASFTLNNDPDNEDNDAADLLTVDQLDIDDITVPSVDSTQLLSRIGC